MVLFAVQGWEVYSWGVWIRFDHFPLSDSCSLMVWYKAVPLKVLCFIWCASLGRIPSTEALAYRGVPNISTSCGYCDFGVENVDYILVGCPFAKVVRDCIWRWCGIKQDTITDIGGLLKFVGLWGRCPKKHVNLMFGCQTNK